jgi:hypothetical protein
VERQLLAIRKLLASAPVETCSTVRQLLRQRAPGAVSRGSWTLSALHVPRRRVLTGGRVVVTSATNSSGQQQLGIPMIVLIRAGDVSRGSWTLALHILCRRVVIGGRVVVHAQPERLDRGPSDGGLSLQLGSRRRPGRARHQRT